MLLAAGCGGGSSQEVAPKVVRGKGYAFQAPADWTIVRSGRQVQAAKGGKSLDLIAVSRFPLLKRFRPELWKEVEVELDRAATGIAAQQHGSISSSEATKLAGEQAKRYDVAYEARGKKLVERIAFVLRGKTEYLLLCRFEQDRDDAPCEQLFTSFRLTRASGRLR